MRDRTGTRRSLPKSSKDIPMIKTQNSSRRLNVQWDKVGHVLQRLMELLLLAERIRHGV